ncbi:hypothetical protein COT50_01715 [candidate division WWE3 bacterium CG08_land_8_20_14_0_20_41_10]|uniref:Capsule synthesis protein CapA domain-containing protein n=1 Tax=candidate division WWE3 bacterium CG08_land_8_20_14_0_20_41_10 TaxID=1975085 RepID=A0A2H0XC26_UNCKA|nr:MAG: hypothetical protein COT50_01715 [candidate division WWE3 bacterium CG08_land_8_20_14_0_20_41_10]
MKVLIVVVAILMFVGVAVKSRHSLSPSQQKNAVVVSSISSPKVVQEKPKKRVVLIATGDVVPGRSVNYQMVKFNNFKWSFEKVNDVLASGDITVVNFEVPLVKNCPTTVEGMVFCGREEAVSGLVASGVDVVTLANNHISDYGVAGIENTVRLMRENGVETVGYFLGESSKGEVLYKTVNDTKFAFLAFNNIYGSIPPILKADKEVIERLVGEARKNADVVVVSMHWGVEYQAVPDDRQVELAHLVADAGADLIIGNHPHWVQNDEQYKNTYIKYAHGNLVFDQMWSEETKKGVIGKYTFENGKLVATEFIPTYIKDYGQPQIVID